MEGLNTAYRQELESTFIRLEDKPGLGVEFNEEEASKHKYKRSYLPVTRLEDGTLYYGDDIYHYDHNG